MAEKEPKILWENYLVRWDFTTKLCGSTPGDPEIAKKWLDARKPRVYPPGGKTIDQIQEEVVATLAEGEDEVEPQKLVFQRVGATSENVTAQWWDALANGNGERALVLRASTVRAHIKECARIVSSLYVGKVEGERSFNVRVLNGVYHDETVYWLPIKIMGRPALELPGGEPITKTYDKPVHARGPRGTQNSIKTIEYVLGASVEFRLKVLGGCVKEKELRTLFEYGGTHGYGGERSDGEGRYLYTLTKEEA